MNGKRMYVDIGTILDEIFDAARQFGQTVQENFSEAKGQPGQRPASEKGPEDPSRPHSPDEGHQGTGCNSWFDFRFDENADYYPTYQYPPMNIYMVPDRSLVFELALAGFEEGDISLSFQGDYMVFSARIADSGLPEEGVRYFKRRLKLKDIEKQKYYAPADKFDQAAVKAVFKNGILKVTIPPKEEPKGSEGVRIEIVKEGE